MTVVNRSVKSIAFVIELTTIAISLSACAPGADDSRYGWKGLNLGEARWFAHEMVEPWIMSPGTPHINVYISPLHTYIVGLSVLDKPPTADDPIERNGLLIGITPGTRQTSFGLQKGLWFYLSFKQIMGNVAFYVKKGVFVPDGETPEEVSLGPAPMGIWGKARKDQVANAYADGYRDKGLDAWLWSTGLTYTWEGRNPPLAPP
jgi:hypothetical protein